MTKEELKQKIFDLDCCFHESLLDSFTEEKLEKIEDVFIKEVKPKIEGKFYPRAVLGFKYKTL